MTSPDADEAAQTLVDGYLANISARLPGPAANRAAILAELRDGLLEAVDGYCERGLTHDDAASAAVAEFGMPELVADSFHPELATVQARWLGLGLLLTGPIVGALWVIATASPIPPWRHAPVGVWAVAPVLGIVVVMGACAAAIAAVSAGRLAQRVFGFATLAPRAALIAGLSAAAADLIALGMLGVVTYNAPGPHAWLTAPIAALAGLGRLAGTRRMLLR